MGKVMERPIKGTGKFLEVRFIGGLCSATSMSDLRGLEFVSFLFVWTLPSLKPTTVPGAPRAWIAISPRRSGGC